ncbi:52 kDa repressor of the inhibitor of the protein kinase-like [Clytia hemisphaerica]|uniref:52 kDa repressor of the inhibitor of the protein kinase-like n=1 Tax=Clytia hemisphaerica TaxID=252671 RepID=UPI0034D45659
MINLFAAEAIVITKPGALSSMAAIFALSNVIGCQIKTVYTPRNSNLFSLYTRVVGTHHPNKNTIQLLWSNTKPEYTKPNHFVFCTTDINYLTSLTSISALSQSIKIDTMECRKRRKQSTISFSVPEKKQKMLPVSSSHLTNSATKPVQSTLLPTSSSTKPVQSTLSSTHTPTSSATKPVQSTLLTTHPPTSSATKPVQSTLSTTHTNTSSDSKPVQSTLSTTHTPICSATTPVQSTLLITHTPTSSATKPVQSILSTTRTSINPTQSTKATPGVSQPVKSAIECHPNDIGLIISRIDHMSDSERLAFLNDVWKPPSNFTFPFRSEFGRRWRFSNNYLDSNSSKYFNWLAYSAHHDGVYCLPCVLFGRKDQTKMKLLLTEPLTRWNAMAAKFRDHQSKSPVHKMAISVMQNLLNQQSKQQQPIESILNQQVSKQVAENREKLIPIVKTALLCARQNIPFRGHRDDGKHLDVKTNNPGNFQELLKFRIDSGDKVLESHFQTCHKNATYRSKTIQNQIIVAAGNIVRRTLAEEIKDAPFYAVMADEASDTSNTEQMALVIRFIDKQSEVREEFIDFLDCTSTKAEYLADRITEALKGLNVDMNSLRGQGYDGAGNMSGAKSGLSARIKSLYPLALYFHCASHRLNLAVAASTNIRGVRNMMDSIRKCSEVFHFSPKKTELLKEKIQELMPEDQRDTLIDVCKTRWLRRIDGLERVHEMMVPILETLDLIAGNHDGSYNKEARSIAQGIYWTFKSFHFILHLIVVRYVMSYTHSLTHELQNKKLDVVKVYKAVDTVLGTLKNCRKNVQEKHSEWYDEAVEFAAKFDVQPSVKRVAGQSTFRENYSTDDIKTYYRNSLTIPLLDRVSTELESRFSQEHRIHYEGHYILPTTVLKGDIWKTKIRAFAMKYRKDLPEPMNIEMEMEQWEHYWQQNKKEQTRLPDTIVSTLKSIDPVKKWFPNIYRILCLIAVVPATSNSCERSISRLRLLKTYLRSRMLQDRLTSLALVYIHREIELDPEEVVDEFAKNNRHRMEFRDILVDAED